MVFLFVCFCEFTTTVLTVVNNFKNCIECLNELVFCKMSNIKIIYFQSILDFRVHKGQMVWELI